MANRWGNNGNSDGLYFLDSKITADGDCSHEIQRALLLGRKAMTNLDSILKSRDIANKGLSSQSYGSSSSHVWMWGLLLLSRFSRIRPCVISQIAAHLAPLSLGFSRQEYWSRLPLPAGDQPRLIQGIRSGDGVGEDQETIA